MGGGGIRSRIRGGGCPHSIGIPKSLIPLLLRSTPSTNIFIKSSHILKSAPTPMENYFKGRNIEEPLSLDAIPIPNLPDNLRWMKVQGGSKMRDLLELALEDFAAGKDVLWSGSGAALVKVVTCAEVVKRKFHPVHQFNSISYTKVDELWEPKIEGLDALVVVRDVPTIHILLSHQPVNAGLPGYQSAGERVKPSGGRSKRTPKANIPPHLEKAGLSFNRGKPRPPKDQKEPHQ